MSSPLSQARRRGERPMIYGRDRERARLRELLDDAIDGHGSLALVSGEAGIGKTTLVDDLIYEAEQRGGLVLSGGCYDLTMTPPYGPWTEITRQYPERDDLPAMPRQLHEGAGMEDIPSQAALFELVSSFFTDVANRQPLLLLLEDLHWSDAESLELLRYVSRSLGGHHILIVATYRSDEITRRHRLAQLLPRLVRESRAERLDLHPLDVAAIGEVVRDRYGLGEDDEERLASYLEERSEGNPLYVEELLYTLESEATLTHSADGGWSLGRLEAVPVPMLIVQLIEDRLSGLEGQTRELLEILAVIGHEVDIDLWRRVSEADAAELIEATRQALGGRIAVEVDDGKRLRFRHALIREALTMELVALERQQWHRRIADLLIESPNPDPDDVVTHLERADDPRLIDWLVKAGVRAMDRLAWDVAVERYEHAVRVLNLQREPEPELLCDLLLGLGAAQDAAGSGRGTTPGSARSSAAPTTYWRAVEAARAADSPTQLAWAAFGLSFWVFASPPTDQRVVGLLEEVLDKLPVEDSSERVLTQAHLAAAYRAFKMFSGIRFESGTEAEIQRLSADAVMMADRIGDPFAAGVSRIARYVAIDHPSQADETQRLLEELLAIERTEELERYGGPRLTHSWRFAQAMVRGAIADAKSADEVTSALYLEDRSPMSALGIRWRAGTFALAEGRFADVESLIEEADTIWPNTGAACNLAFALRREQDRLRDVESRMTAILQRAPGSPWFNLCWTLLLIETGSADEARAQFDQLDINDVADLTHGAFWAHAMVICAELSVVFGDAERVRTCYELLAAYPDHVIYVAYIFVCLGSVSHYLGLLASFLGEWQAAEAHFERALDQHQEMGFHPLAAHTQQAWARMLLQQGEASDRERAVELLDRASETADRLGMIRLQRLTAEAREEFGAEDDDSFPFDLSQREVEVLRLVVEGMTDGEIAEELYLSPRTISTYLSSIYNKLGVNSRAAAAAITVRSGLA